MPLKISKKAFKLIDDICVNELAQYKPDLKRVAAVRFLQKMRNFYTSVKL